MNSILAWIISAALKVIVFAALMLVGIALVSYTFDTPSEHHSALFWAAIAGMTASFITDIATYKPGRK